MLGYLINVYPMASQTFIRRESAAIEAEGRPVRRYAQRAWDTELVDPEDHAETAKTRRILDVGPAGLVLSTIASALTRPTKFARALASAWRLGGISERGRRRHMIYLAEACVLRKWMEQDGVTHLHAHFGANSATIALLCRLLGGPPYSFTVHGPEEFDQSVGNSLGEKIKHSAFAVAISWSTVGSLVTGSVSPQIGEQPELITKAAVYVLSPACAAELSIGSSLFVRST